MASNSAFQTDTFIKAVQGAARPYMFVVIPGANVPGVSAILRDAQAALADALKVGPGAVAAVIGQLSFIGLNAVNNDLLNIGQHALLIKASGFPSSEVASLDVKFRGRVANLLGDRTFGDYKFTAYQTPSHDMRNRYLSWHDGISDAKANVRRMVAFDQLYRDFTVVQLSTIGLPSAAVVIRGAFPKSVGEVALDSDTSGLSTFDVTFAYQWFEKIDTSTFSDSLSVATSVTGTQTF